MEILRKIVAPIIVILFFFIVLFAYTKLAGPIPFDITQVTTSKSDAFTVTGEGKVQAIPDSAAVRLGVVAKAATAEAVKLKLNSNINNVIESIKGLGVDEGKIKTENYNIYPEYGEAIMMLPKDSGSPIDNNRISGYTADTNITVIVDSADLANKIVDAGTASGANQVGGIDFQVKDKEKAMNQARELAVADAKKKAENAARIAGFKLGKVINYSESENGDYPRFMMAKSEGTISSNAPTQVQPGTNEIMMSVSLSYEIK